MDELITLRVTVARLAQRAAVDNKLRVTGKVHEELVELARTRQEGWNNLLWFISEELSRLQEADRRQYHEGEANATPEFYLGTYDDPVLEGEHAF